MSSIGYSSPSVHYSSPGNMEMDMDMFKLTLTRRLDGSFDWSPDYGSQAWVDALNFEFPDDSTIEQKMRMAVARKIREEQQEMAMFAQTLPVAPNPPFMGERQASFSSGAPTLNGPGVSPLEQPIRKTLTPPSMSNHRSKLAASGAGRVQKPAKKMEDHIITFATKAGGPITKGRKGPLDAKQREDAKRSRKNKSVCEDHKRSRTKCDPEKCPKNKLYTGPKTPALPVVEGHSRTPSNASRRSNRSGLMDNSSNQSFGTSNFPQTPTAPTISQSASPSIGTPLFNGNQHGAPYAVGMRFSSPGFVNPALVWPEHQYMGPPRIMGSTPSSNADPFNYTYQPNNYQSMYPSMNPVTNYAPDNMLDTAPVKSLSQDESMFPPPDANDPVMGIPRQDSYASHGSAHEYFTSDELPPVDPNAPFPELSPELMRDMEMIQNEFGTSHTFRSVDAKKKHMKKWWTTGRLFRFLRRVYYSDIFQRKRKPEDYGTSGTEWINVDMIEVVEGPKPGKKQKNKGKRVSKLRTVDERHENDERQNSAARVEQWANHVQPPGIAAEMNVNDASGKGTGKPPAGIAAAIQEGNDDELTEGQPVPKTESATTTTSIDPATSASEAEATTTDEETQNDAKPITVKGEGNITEENNDRSITAPTAESEPTSKTAATVTNTEIKAQETSSDEKTREAPSNAKKDAAVMEEVITLISAIQVAEQPPQSKTEGLVEVKELNAGAIGV